MGPGKTCFNKLIKTRTELETVSPMSKLNEKIGDARVGIIHNLVDSVPVMVVEVNCSVVLDNWQSQTSTKTDVVVSFRKEMLKRPMPS